MPMNSLSGFAVSAAVSLLNGGSALSAPSSSNSAYSGASSTDQWKEIVDAGFPGALEFGDQFPQLFGAVPPEYRTPAAGGTAALSAGRLMETASSRIGTVLSKGVGGFSSIMGMAKGYGSQCADLLQSAASCTFGGDPAKMLTGGLSKLGGTDPASLAKVGSALGGLGGAVNLANPAAAMSPVNALKGLVDKGANFVSNLNSSVLGKAIKDPVSGLDLKIDSKLFDEIGAKATAVGGSVADNPLSKSLGSMMDSAIKGTADLKSMAGFAGAGSALKAVSNPLDFGISQMGRAAALKPPALDIPSPGTAASAISSAVKGAVDAFGNKLPSLPDLPSVGAVSKFTDTLDINKQLGSAASALTSSLGITSLDPKKLASGLADNIGGLDKIAALGGTKALGDAMGKIQMPKVDLLGDKPLSQADFHGLISAVGGGSGPAGNPKIEDILGGTNLQEAMTKAASGLAKIPGVGQINDTMREIIRLKNLPDNPLTPGANLAAAKAMFASLKNSNLAAQVYQSAKSIPAAADMFKTFNGIAESHNNSMSLMTKADIDISSVKDTVGAKLSFVSSLGGLGLSNKKLGGADFVNNLIDTGTKAGQAIKASMVEAVNSKILGDIGAKVDIQSPGNPLDTFKPPKTGGDILGGGKLPSIPTKDELLANVPDFKPPSLPSGASELLKQAAPVLGNAADVVKQQVSQGTAALSSAQVAGITGAVTNQVKEITTSVSGSLNG